MNEKVEFFVKPKQLSKQYKKQSFTLTFLPETKLWKWEVTYVQTTKYSDTAKTMIAAQKAAEKHIDHTLALRGGK
jgi:hypothetical protein